MALDIFAQSLKFLKSHEIRLVIPKIDLIIMCLFRGKYCLALISLGIEVPYER